MNLGVGGSASSSVTNLGVLSPLDLPSSPSTSNLGTMNNFSSPRKTLARGASSQSLLTSTLLRKDKGKAPEMTPPSSFSESLTSLRTSATRNRSVIVTDENEEEGGAVPTHEELKVQARAFREKIILKRWWNRWKKRLTDVMAWAQAVEHSDAYHAKLKSQKSLQSFKESRLSARAGGVEKRRRVASGVGEGMAEGGSVDGSPSKKRQRKKRISDVFQDRRTDEEIAKRFREVRYLSLFLRSFDMTNLLSNHRIEKKIKSYGRKDPILTSSAHTSTRR